MSKGKRAQFTLEFKIEAVRLVRGGQSIGAVSQVPGVYVANTQKTRVGSAKPSRASRRLQSKKDLGIRPLLLAHPTHQEVRLQSPQKTCSMNALQSTPQNAA